MSTRAAPVATAVVLGPKLLKVVVAALKSAKVVKLGLGVGSVVGYAWLFSWQFSVLIVASLVVHEYGHVWAMRQVGIPTRGFYLIPFVGGAAVPERAFRNRLEEQYVSIMGPLFGLAQATVMYAAFLATGHALLGAAAGWVAMLNLFNLLPIPPLDGGRIWKSAAFSIGYGKGLIIMAVAAALGLAVMILFRFGLLAVFGALAVIEMAWEMRAVTLDGTWHARRMDSDQMWRSLGLYTLVVFGCLAIMAGVRAVPETALAMQMLRAH